MQYRTKNQIHNDYRVFTIFVLYFSLCFVKENVRDDNTYYIAELLPCRYIHRFI